MMEGHMKVFWNDLEIPEIKHCPYLNSDLTAAS